MPFRSTARARPRWPCATPSPPWLPQRIPCTAWKHEGVPRCCGQTPLMPRRWPSGALRRGDARTTVQPRSTRPPGVWRARRAHDDKYACLPLVLCPAWPARACRAPVAALPLCCDHRTRKPAGRTRVRACPTSRRPLLSWTRRARPFITKEKSSTWLTRGKSAWRAALLAKTRGPWCATRALKPLFPGQTRPATRPARPKKPPPRLHHATATMNWACDAGTL